MQHRIALGALGFAALALVVCGWLTQRSVPAASVEGDPLSAAQAQVAVQTVAATVSDQRAQPSPKPSADTSIAPAASSAGTTLLVAGEPLLRDEIADLDRRARTGDAAAACRLGAELLRCERARMLQPYTDNVEEQARALAQRAMRQEEIDRQIDAALRRQAENAAALARCEGVEEARWPAPARYFHLAAQAGHRPSMLQFLNPERFRADQLFRDPELIALFRANASRYFMQLLEEGDVELLQRWSLGAALPNDILSGVLPPPYNEPGFAAAMQQQLLNARGVQSPPGLQRAAPTPEQLGEAERQYSRYFGSRSPETEEQRRRRFMTSPYDLGSFRCDEAPHGAP